MHDIGLRTYLSALTLFISTLLARMIWRRESLHSQKPL